MKTATIITIETILEADRSVSKAKREKIMDLLLDRDPAAPKKKELITPGQAAEILGVHVATLRRYVRQGRIEEIRISNRKIRYDVRKIIKMANGEES